MNSKQFVCSCTIVEISSDLKVPYCTPIQCFILGPGIHMPVFVWFSPNSLYPVLHAHFPVALMSFTKKRLLHTTCTKFQADLSLKCSTSSMLVSNKACVIRLIEISSDWLASSTEVLGFVLATRCAVLKQMSVS